MERQDSEMIALREDDVAIRHGSDDIGYFLAHDGSHAVPNFAPIGKVPVEILAEIFVQCVIPSGQCDRLDPMEYKLARHPQMIREQLGQVCQMWNTIIDNNPRIWATIILYNEFLDPEMVSLCIKKSKSHPLDVFFWSKPGEKQDERQAILPMLHKEFWRIHILVGDFSKWDLSALFPLGVSTEAPIMQTFIICGRRPVYQRNDTFGDIGFPQLHSLSVFNYNGIKLFVNPMENVHQLDINYYGGPIHLYLKILDLLPNLVSLRWHDVLRQPMQEEFFRVKLRSLKFLTLECDMVRVTSYLACLYVPSSPHLDPDPNDMFNSHFSLNEPPHTFSGDRSINLRCLRLLNGIPSETKIHAILHQLKHLITLALNCQTDRRSVDALLLALSPLNQDFSSVCPQLKTVELTSVSFSSSALEAFVKRRVKSDLDYPAPGLVTSLALDSCGFRKDLRAQLVRAYSSSITIT